MGRIYTSGEAARLCALSLTTIKRWIKQGALRAYRTPGGDIRISEDQLREFMREYDIPMQRLDEEVVTLLVATESRVLRRGIVEFVDESVPDCRIEIAEDELDLGFRLGAFRPRVVVMDGAGERTAGRCGRIRSLLAPQPVRIAVVGASPGGEPVTPTQDVHAVRADAGEREVADLLGLLLDGLVTVSASVP